MAFKMEVPALVLGGEFVSSRPYTQIAAQSEDVQPRYNIHIGKDKRIWLVTTDQDPDHIIVQGGPGSQGYGGADLVFTLANGVDKITLHGPWHSNPYSLFEQTGIDLRTKIISWGVIGRGLQFRAANSYSSDSVITDLVYFDKAPTQGVYDRIQNLAKEMSDAEGIPLYYHMRTYGGSSTGPVNWKLKGTTKPADDKIVGKDGKVIVTDGL